MRVALIPLKTKPSCPTQNLRELEARLTSIVDANPDLIVVPECTLTGYVYHEDDLNRFAEPIPGPCVSAFAQLAWQYRTYLCFGMVERAGKHVYNSGVLLDRDGHVVLVQRKLSEQPPFQAGSRLSVAATELGKIALLICGDLFHADAVTQLPDDLDWVIAPMVRGFAGQSPDRQRWETEERAEYLNAVKATCKTTFLVNALDQDVEEPSFGGAMVVDGAGNILAESPHGSDNTLLFET